MTCQALDSIDSPRREASLNSKCFDASGQGNWNFFRICTRAYAAEQWSECRQYSVSVSESCVTSVS